jgi:hypothetical protein
MKRRKHKYNSESKEKKAGKNLKEEKEIEENKENKPSCRNNHNRLDNNRMKTARRHV